MKKSFYGTWAGSSIMNTLAPVSKGISATSVPYTAGSASSSGFMRRSDDSKEQGRRETLLIVEDEARVGFALALMATQLGYAVRLAQTVDQALEALETDEQITAIMADYRLYGEFTGLDVLIMSRRHHPQLRRVLISGLLLPDQDSTWRTVCDAFLIKPFSREQLWRALHEEPDERVTGASAAAFWWH